jgi:hypothetical protein
MMTILAIVNAEKEGQIESKMMKSRHMEEIREARKKEAEARQEKKKSSLVCTIPITCHTSSPNLLTRRSVGRDKRFSTTEAEAQE